MKLIKKLIKKLRGEYHEKVYNDFWECYFSSSDFNK